MVVILIILKRLKKKGPIFKVPFPTIVFRLSTFSPVAQFRFGDLGAMEAGKSQKLIPESQNSNGDSRENMITELRLIDVSAEEWFKNVVLI